MSKRGLSLKMYVRNEIRGVSSYDEDVCMRELCRE